MSEIFYIIKIVYKFKPRLKTRVASENMTYIVHVIKRFRLHIMSSIKPNIFSYRYKGPRRKIIKLREYN
jgi:hypothetical protein